MTNGGIGMLRMYVKAYVWVVSDFLTFSINKSAYCALAVR